MAGLFIHDQFFDYQMLSHSLNDLPGNEPWMVEISEFLSHWFNEDPQIEIPTSGSTGPAKLIRVLKSDMMRSARYSLDHFDLKAGMTALLCLPAKLIAGKMMLVRCLVGGLNCIAVRPSARPLADVNKAIDFMAITPYQAHHLIEENEKSLEAVSVVIIGGAAINEEDRLKLAGFGNQIFATYGMTETITHIATMKLSQGSKETSFKRIHSDFNLKTDANSQLVINSPYQHMPLVQTNDVVQLLNNNEFNILGRADNVINSGGIKIHPEEIEKRIAHLMKSPYMIAGLPHDSLGQEVVLIIEGRGMEGNENVLMEISETLEKSYACPRRIIHLKELVYTDSHKINRKASLSLIS